MLKSWTTRRHDSGGNVREDTAQSNGETRFYSPALSINVFCSGTRPLSLGDGSWRCSAGFGDGGGGVCGAPVVGTANWKTGGEFLLAKLCFWNFKGRPEKEVPEPLLLFGLCKSLWPPNVGKFGEVKTNGLEGQMTCELDVAKSPPKEKPLSLEGKIPSSIKPK